MNRKKRKTALILLPAILCAIVLLGIRGTRKTIDKTVPARVYEDNGTTYAPSSITISGTLRKTWSSTDFVGTFATDGYEPSCRDGVEAKINWGDNEYPILTFFYAGDFSQLDVKGLVAGHRCSPHWQAASRPMGSLGISRLCGIYLFIFSLSFKSQGCGSLPKNFHRRALLWLMKRVFTS